MLLSLAWIFLLGLALGGLMQKLGLPSLLGMLLTGILLAQLGAIDASLLDISSSLREIALVTILLRAGLNLSVQDLKRAGRPAVLLCFLPAVCAGTDRRGAECAPQRNARYEKEGERDAARSLF